ncbi:MAG: hypothetical protein ACYDCC_00070 [Actinomycetota bacterium]
MTAVLAVIAIITLVALQKKPTQPVSSPTAAPSNEVPASCLPLKPAINVPTWYPKDLSVPPGSYPIEVQPDVGGYRRIVFAVNGSLRDFVIYALTNWKQHGYTLGRGDAEAGEAEDNFAKNPLFGVFRARSVFCDASKTWVLITVNDPSKARKTVPTFGKRTPGVTHTTLQ